MFVVHVKVNVLSLNFLLVTVVLYELLAELFSYIQSLCQQSKTCTSLADQGSASGYTFQCMNFLPFFYLFFIDFNASSMAQKKPSPLLWQKSLVAAPLSMPVSIADMQRSFAAVVTKTISSLESTISTEQFAVTLLALGAYEPATKKEQALLEDHEDEISDAKSIPGIYKIIRHYMSFFNPELLGYIIELHGTQANRDDFREYMNKLNTFCQSIVVPPMKFSSEEQSWSVERRGEIRIKLDLSDRRLQCLRNVKSSIATILGVEKVVLFVDSVVEGSIEVILLVPQFVVRQLFPLLDVQVKTISSRIGDFKLRVTGSDYIDFSSFEGRQLVWCNTIQCHVCTYVI